VLEGAKRSVLVVEDNPAALKLFRAALEGEGYSVLAAFDARMALEQAARRLPDLVLQDLVLPDMDGLTLLRALRALPNGKEIPIIAVSGFKTLLAQAKDEPHGFDATLVKPVQPAALVELVANYLPPPSRVAGFGAGKSILVVDDDRVQLKLARLRLEHAGFSVRVASDGRAALEEAARQPPDIVLCDVLMPGADGYELCQELRRLPGLERVPVVLVSAYYGGAEDEQLARSVGARALVTRTPELGEVLDALRRVINSGGEPGSVRGAQLERVDLPKDQQVERVMAQLKRQAHASAGFAEKAALQSAQLSILAGIAAALLRSEDVEAAFGEVLSACLEAGGISRGALYRLDDAQELELTQALGFPDAAAEALGCAFGCSERVTHAGQGMVVVVGGSSSATPAERDSFVRAGLTAAVFIPFLEGERCIGALLLGSSTTELEERELTVFARAIGAHISQALALTESFSRLRDAAEAGRVLAASLDLDETLAALARLATGRLADVCEIELVGKEPCVYIAGRVCDPSLGRRIQQVRVSYPRLVAGASSEDAPVSVRSELVASITDERLRETARNAEHLQLLRGLGLKSEIIVPLLGRGRLLGIVSFARVLDGRAFTPRDQLAAEDLASRAAVAIDNASLYKIAQDASRMKDEFLATVSHELRTPLTAILGWAHLLSGGLANAKREHAYQVIERNARAQAQLIEDLLDTSRIISGQMRLDLKLTDLTRIVEQAAESLKPTLELKNLQLRRVLPGAPIRIRADAARLQQIIWNLLFNAAKFTPTGGNVEIRVEPCDSHVTVWVTDDGQGIEPEFLPFVFDRFKQAEGGITRAHGGLGLGLSIARHLAELHGGSISVQSEGKGRGAAFEVQLPLTTDPVEAAPSRTPEVSRRRLHPASEIADVAVLVVDDDDDARELMLEALVGHGARVSGAASAAEALAVVAEERPDILLSDIGMPGEDGYSLIRRIRTLAPCDGGTIPAAAITAYNRSEDRLLALDAGFQLHLAKPVDPSDLVAAVVRLRRMAAGTKPA
jgi:CheY-like chemotaxis protein